MAKMMQGGKPGAVGKGGAMPDSPMDMMAMMAKGMPDMKAMMGGGMPDMAAMMGGGGGMMSMMGGGMPDMGPMGMQKLMDCIIEVMLNRPPSDDSDSDEDSITMEIPCQYCSRLFSSQMSLKTHILVAHDHQDTSVLNIRSLNIDGKGKGSLKARQRCKKSRESKDSRRSREASAASSPVDTVTLDCIITSTTTASSTLSTASVLLTSSVEDLSAAVPDKEGKRSQAKNEKVGEALSGAAAASNSEVPTQVIDNKSPASPSFTVKPQPSSDPKSLPPKKSSPPDPKPSESPESKTTPSPIESRKRKDSRRSHSEEALPQLTTKKSKGAKSDVEDISPTVAAVSENAEENTGGTKIGRRNRSKKVTTGKDEHSTTEEKSISLDTHESPKTRGRRSTRHDKEAEGAAGADKDSKPDTPQRSTRSAGRSPAVGRKGRSPAGKAGSAAASAPPVGRSLRSRKSH
jgi:hypothetical protein